MLAIMIQAFWNTATALTVLLVPITVIIITFRLFFAGLFGGRRD